eukprot:comp11550_c0_seq1/m.6012 comp11550_c0_seq1/g.6012  ORF comp11550_c0_seq1/g.6012 comp11550_c0_seq1/m.6012 type:complete len:949 (-) comp11550_c0_seq1:1327-4173(-)
MAVAGGAPPTMDVDGVGGERAKLTTLTILIKSGTDSQEGAERALNRRLALTHQHLIRIVGFTISHGTVSVRLDLSKSYVSLQSLLKEKGPLDTDSARRLGHVLVDVLDYMHSEDVVHGALDATCVYLDPPNRHWYVDFNVPILLGLRDLAVGTACAAPETWDGRQPWVFDGGQPSDIFAMGAVLYESLYAHDYPRINPEGPATAADLTESSLFRADKDMPKPVRGFLCRCLNIDPVERPMAAQCADAWEAQNDQLVPVDPIVDENGGDPKLRQQLLQENLFKDRKGFSRTSRITRPVRGSPNVQADRSNSPEGPVAANSLCPKPSLITGIMPPSTPAWGQSDVHKYEVTTFAKPTYCQFCRVMLWGFKSQGYRCKDCGMVACKRCQDQNAGVCITEKTKHNGPEDGGHDWYEPPRSILFCNAYGCRGSNIVSGTVYRCASCGVCSHDKTCRERVRSTILCKPQYRLSTDGPSLFPCHLIEGNVSQSQPGCRVCDSSVTSSKSLTGWRCAWCQRTVHTACCDRGGEANIYIRLPCNYGKYSALIAKPHDCVLTGTEVDKNGNQKNVYSILPTGDISGTEDGSRPLAVFINCRSGGQAGQKVMQGFRRYLNSVQLFDLGQGGPDEGLKMFKATNQPFNVLACGGDGTVGWLLSSIDKLWAPTDANRPTVGVLPLGTGNDLARTLGFGGGYNGESIRLVLDNILSCTSVLMDRWAVRVFDDVDVYKTASEGNIGHTPPTHVLNNYFSIGIDAKVALNFHHARQNNPQMFKSRTTNKMVYGFLGAKEMLDKVDLKKVRVYIKEKDKPHQQREINVSGYQGIIVVNLPSYAGGTDLWRSNELSSSSQSADHIATGSKENGSQQPTFVKQSISDGMLEVVGVKSSLHVGQIKVSLSSGSRLGQGDEVVIHLDTEQPQEEGMPMQVDGEPWEQKIPSVVHISFHQRVPMLYSAQK